MSSQRLSRFCCHMEYEDRILVKTKKQSPTCSNLTKELSLFVSDHLFSTYLLADIILNTPCYIVVQVESSSMCKINTVFPLFPCKKSKSAVYLCLIGTSCPQEPVEYPVENSQNPTGQSSEQHAVTDPSLGWLGLDNLQISLPTSMIPLLYSHVYHPSFNLLTKSQFSLKWAFSSLFARLTGSEGRAKFRKSSWHILFRLSWNTDQTMPWQSIHDHFLWNTLFIHLFKCCLQTYEYHYKMNHASVLYFKTLFLKEADGTDWQQLLKTFSSIRMCSDEAF